MYLVYIYLSLLFICEFHCKKKVHSSRCHNDRNRHEITIRGDPEKFFNRFSKDLLDADRKYKSFCDRINNKETRIVYDREYYKIVTPMQYPGHGVVVVTIKHRALFVSVRDEDGEVKKIVEVRVLPDFVDGNKAKWSIVDGQIEITIPYKVTFGKMMTMSCGDIGDAVLTVPKRRIHYDDDDLSSIVKPIQINLAFNSRSGY